MGEFVEGFEELSDVGAAVSIFGSARTKPEDEMYGLARRTAEAIGREGFAIITGAGPGIMEAAHQGARDCGDDPGEVARLVSATKSGGASPGS